MTPLEVALDDRAELLHALRDQHETFEALAYVASTLLHTVAIERERRETAERLAVDAQDHAHALAAVLARAYTLCPSLLPMLHGEFGRGGGRRHRARRRPGGRGAVGAVSRSSLSFLQVTGRCALVVRAGARCVWCRVKLTRENTQIDHVVPRRHHGSNRADNLVAACGVCNLWRTEDEATWRAHLASRGVRVHAIEARVRRQLAAPVDRAAGRRLALRWYPWAAAYFASQAEGARARRARLAQRNEAARAQGLGGEAFPFGAGEL